MRVKKFSEDLPDLNILDKGDLIDLYCNSFDVAENNEVGIKWGLAGTYKSDSVCYKKDDILVVGLGMAMELPKNKKAEVTPRSGTFKKYGLLLTNSVGQIDNSYRGDSDEWMAVFYCTRDGSVDRFDRLLQFEIKDRMIKPTIEYVDSFGNDDRGGYGSSGK